MADSAAKILAPFFLSCADDSGIKLSEISVTGYKTGNPDEPGLTYGDIHLHELDGSGRTATVTIDGETYNKSYWWFDDTELPEDSEYPAGWYDEASIPLDDSHPMGSADTIKFTKGNGVWAYGQYDTMQIVLAGQVAKADAQFTSPADSSAKMIGNLYAVDLKLSDMYVDGYKTGNPDEPGLTYGDIHLHELDGSGRTATVTIDGETYNKSYWWFDDTELPEDSEYPAGWYDEASIPLDKDHPMGSADTIQFTPGQGLWFYGQYDTMTLHVTAPSAVRAL